MVSALTHLECTRCAATVEATVLQGHCPCGSPYYARYDLSRVAELMPRDDLAAAPPNLWRYRHALPLDPERAPVTLGEGCTPTISVRRAGANGESLRVR